MGNSANLAQLSGNGKGENSISAKGLYIVEMG